MQSKTTYVTAGWDFTTPIWRICDGGDWPRLDWEFTDGDLNADGSVDLSDFSQLGGNWQEPDSSQTCGGSDITDDGSVDLDDLGQLTQNWLTGK